MNELLFVDYGCWFKVRIFQVALKKRTHPISKQRIINPGLALDWEGTSLSWVSEMAMGQADKTQAVPCSYQNSSCSWIFIPPKKWCLHHSFWAIRYSWRKWRKCPHSMRYDTEVQAQWWIPHIEGIRWLRLLDLSFLSTEWWNVETKNHQSANDYPLVNCDIAIENDP